MAAPREERSHPFDIDGTPARPESRTGENVDGDGPIAVGEAHQLVTELFHDVGRIAAGESSRCLESERSTVESAFAHRVHVFDGDAIDLRYFGDEEIDETLIGEFDEKFVDDLADTALEDLDTDDITSDGADTARNLAERSRSVGNPDTYRVNGHGMRTVLATGRGDTTLS
jgi:hypothetical protein